MSRLNPLTLPTALLTAVVAVGCEDSTTEPAEPLTQQETEALYRGMEQMQMDTTAQVISVTPDGGVVACPLGGQATVAAEFNEETVGDTVRLMTNYTIDPEGCVLSSESNEFTLDGNPNVTTEVNVGIVGSTFEFLVDGSVTGGLDWQLDDRSGTCMIDLIFGLGDTQPMTATVSGTMCGHEVEFDAGNIGPGM